MALPWGTGGGTNANYGSVSIGYGQSSKGILDGLGKILSTALAAFVSGQSGGLIDPKPLDPTTTILKKTDTICWSDQ